MLLVTCCYLMPCSSQTRLLDSLGVLREFMQVCNSYKKLPLHVRLTVQNSADIVTDPAIDTAAFTMEFFIQDKGAYIKLGDNEEVINDSLMLFINHKPKRMSLHANRGLNMVEQMSRFTGGLMQDSSVQKLAVRYSGMYADTLLKEGMAVIKLKSKALVIGGILSKDEIEATYKNDSKLPVRLVQVQRKLVPIDSATYAGLIKDTLYEDRLVHPGNGYWFLIKQSVSTYTFNQIDYSNTTQLPLQVSDCIIIKQAPGKASYVTAKEYETFRLIEDL